MSIYKGYQIEPKKDFGSGRGFLIDGKYVKSGYIVTDGTCNVLPGATWTTTIWKARGLIDALIESEGDSSVFWHIARNQQPA